jgi:dephospho-CoA kinase
MMAIRIALIGKSGAGKSKVSKYLVETHGFAVIRTGVICRQVSMILFGNEEKSSTQRLDDALTVIDPSIFLRASLRCAILDGDIVIDSLRFREDVLLARSLHFLTLKVLSDPGLRLDRLTSRGQLFDPAIEGSHRSETELDGEIVDYEIENDGTLRDLTSSVDDLIRGLR